MPLCTGLAHTLHGPRLTLLAISACVACGLGVGMLTFEQVLWVCHCCSFFFCCWFVFFSTSWSTHSNNNCSTSTNYIQQHPTGGCVGVGSLVDTAVNLQACQTQNGSILSSLFSHYLLPPLSLSSLFLEPLGAISCSFGDCQCYGLHAIVVCHWFPLIRSCAFTPNPQPWILSLIMSITGHCQQGQEHSPLSYLHHIILGLDVRMQWFLPYWLLLSASVDARLIVGAGS